MQAEAHGQESPGTYPRRWTIELLAVRLFRAEDCLIAPALCFSPVSSAIQPPGIMPPKSASKRTPSKAQAKLKAARDALEAAKTAGSLAAQLGVKSSSTPKTKAHKKRKQAVEEEEDSSEDTEDAASRRREADAKSIKRAAALAKKRKASEPDIDDEDGDDALLSKSIRKAAVARARGASEDSDDSDGSSSSSSSGGSDSDGPGASVLSAASLIQVSKRLLSLAALASPPFSEAKWGIIYAETDVLWTHLARIPSLGMDDVSSDEAPDATQWAAALGFAAAAGVGGDGGAAAAATPVKTKPAKLHFASLGDLASSGRSPSQDRRAFLPNPSKGRLSVPLGPRVTEMEYQYSLDACPDVANVLGAQFNLVFDAAVLEDALAMKRYTGDITAKDYGANLAAVKKSIITGVIAPLETYGLPGKPKNLLNATKCLGKLIGLLKSHYPPEGCYILEHLQSLKTNESFERWAAIIVKALPNSATVEAESEAYVFARFDEAMGLWREQALDQLNDWFGTAAKSVSVDGPSGHKHIIVGHMEDFKPPVLSQCFADAGHFVTVKPSKGKAGGSASGGAGGGDADTGGGSAGKGGGSRGSSKGGHGKGKSAKAATSVDASWPDDNSEVPEFVRRCMGKKFFDVQKKYRSEFALLESGGKPICGKFLLCGEGKYGCTKSDKCDFLHFPLPEGTLPLP